MGHIGLFPSHKPNNPNTSLYLKYQSEILQVAEVSGYDGGHWLKDKYNRDYYDPSGGTQIPNWHSFTVAHDKM